MVYYANLYYEIHKYRLSLYLEKWHMPNDLCSDQGYGVFYPKRKIAV